MLGKIPRFIPTNVAEAGLFTLLGELCDPPEGLSRTGSTAQVPQPLRSVSRGGFGDTETLQGTCVDRDERDFPGFIWKEKITEGCAKGQALCRSCANIGKVRLTLQLWFSALHPRFRGRKSCSSPANVTAPALPQASVPKGTQNPNSAPPCLWGKTFQSRPREAQQLQDKINDPQAVKTCIVSSSSSCSPGPGRRARLPEGPHLTQQGRSRPRPHIVA